MFLSLAVLSHLAKKKVPPTNIGYSHYMKEVMRGSAWRVLRIVVDLLWVWQCFIELFNWTEIPKYFIVVEHRLISFLKHSYFMASTVANIFQLWNEIVWVVQLVNLKSILLVSNTEYKILIACSPKTTSSSSQSRSALIFVKIDNYFVNFAIE